MLTIVCANTIMICVFSTTYKNPPFFVIHFIITTLNNEQHPCKRLIVDEYGTLENSTDLTNFLVGNFIIYMEITGSDASWLNGNN